MFDPIAILEAIQLSPFYTVLLVFFAWYPLYTSAVWVFSAIHYSMRHEKKDRDIPRDDYYPPATILISAFNEELNIERTITGCLEVDYPNFEVVVVDDGSTDGTVDILAPFVNSGDVRLFAKKVNEGKAMALNDVIPYTNGEIILFIDADAIPDRQILRMMVPHFQSPRVAAVTGNPRVVNRSSFLSKIQTIEFSSIISLQRRGARTWGKLLTVSGVVAAFHRDALADVGMFSPDMATEDIDLTWKLQLNHYQIRYEPKAVVWMRVPNTFRGLWRQRRRWALGLAQVVQRHSERALSWENRRLWPVISEACFSILWAYTFVFLTALWLISYAFGYPPVGVSPMPNYWGMIIGTMCLVQLLTGVILDSRYDKDLPRYFVIAVLYPLIYWILTAVITVVSTPRGFRARIGKRAPVRWKPVRESA